MRVRACILIVIWLVRALYADELTWPSNSIYSLPALSLENQLGRQENIASWSGHPYLLGMFYGSCQMVCPIEIEAIKTFEDRFHAQGNPWIKVNLISFDSSHDQRTNLKQEADQHHLNSAWYQLWRVKQGDLGYLAGVLGVTWRALPGGGFKHNAVVALMDSQGRVVAKTTALALVHDESFLHAVQAQSSSVQGVP